MSGHSHSYTESKIPVIISNRSLHTKSTYNRTVQNLNIIRCKNNLSITERNIKAAALNIRSLSGKSLLINDYIISHDIHVLFLSETWLDRNSEQAVLIETCPTDYHFISETRKNKRGGGLAVIFHQSLNFKKVSSAPLNI